MNALFQDIVHDLRSKRLLPVAALLAVALVAAPVALLKLSSQGSGEGSEPAAAVDGAAGGGPSAADLAALLALEETPVAGSSNLGVFKSKNPFRPHGLKLGDDAEKLASEIEESLSSLLPGDGGSGGGGDTSLSLTTESKSTGSVSTGGGETSEPSGGGGGGEPATKPVLYKFVVDVKFGRTGEEKTQKGLGMLSMLPSERTPLLVYLGVTSTQKTAVFMLDSELSQSGEGRCMPSVTECSFVYMRPTDDRDEHVFADERGREYTLELVRIRRVKIDAKDGGGGEAKTSRRSRDAEGEDEPRAFRPPQLVDLAE